MSIRWVVALRAAIWMVVATMLSGLAWSWISGGFIARILDPDLTATTRLEVFRAGFLRAGYWAPLLYIAFTCGEVIVAPIPGQRSTLARAAAIVLIAPRAGTRTGAPSLQSTAAQQLRSSRMASPRSSLCSLKSS